MSTKKGPEFSLFRDDTLQRVLFALGLRTPGARGVFFRSCFFWLITWIPLALLAIYSGYFAGHDDPRLSFVRDVAALGQFVFGFPLFLLAEHHIDHTTAHAAQVFFDRDIVRKNDRAYVVNLFSLAARIRKNWWIDIVLVVLAVLSTSGWIRPELSNGVNTWHAVAEPGSRVEHLTAPGWYAAFFAVPLLNYWWLRWLLKCSVWSWFLWKVSRLPLKLFPTHADRTAGLYFVSKVQTSFGVVIFAFGCSIVAATVGYKLVIENANPMTFGVWGPLAAYIIGAPLVFTLPLLAFTSQLRAAKKIATEQFNVQLQALSEHFEKNWLAETKHDGKSIAGPEISAMADVMVPYHTVKKLRVVPFDFESITKLVASTVAPVIPLANWLGIVPEPVMNFLEYVEKVLGSLNWHG